MCNGYLVKTIFSNSYSSYNSFEYYKKLQQISKPWYYKFYIYTPTNECFIDRRSLKSYDLEIFKLNLKAHKIWKAHKKFYWLYDNNLKNSFNNLWIELLNDPSIAFIRSETFIK